MCLQVGRIAYQKETDYVVKRDLFQYEKRPISVWKETLDSMYLQVGRIACQKETDYVVKRDLFQYEKRPISIWKET